MPLIRDVNFLNYIDFPTALKNKLMTVHRSAIIFNNGVFSATLYMVQVSLKKLNKLVSFNLQFITPILESLVSEDSSEINEPRPGV